MPQLDFVWWMIKFFIMWTSVLAVLTMLTAKMVPSSAKELFLPPKISKTTTEWQWS